MKLGHIIFALAVANMVAAGLLALERFGPIPALGLGAAGA